MALRPHELQWHQNFRRSNRVIVSVLVLLSILFTIGNNAFEFNNVTRYTNLLAVTQSGWKSSSIDTFDLTTAIQKEYVRYTSNTNVILKLNHVDTFYWQKKKRFTYHSECLRHIPVLEVSGDDFYLHLSTRKSLVSTH